jgi:hypothetical protein
MKNKMSSIKLNIITEEQYERNQVKYVKLISDEEEQELIKKLKEQGKYKSVDSEHSSDLYCSDDSETRVSKKKESVRETEEPEEIENEPACEESSDNENNSEEEQRDNKINLSSRSKNSNRRINKTKKVNKWTKGSTKKQCSWIMQKGINKGKCCPNQVEGSGKHGSDLYCTPCLDKSSVKMSLEKKRISPTLSKLQEKIEKIMIEEEMNGFVSFHNDDFQDVDLYNLLFIKNEEKAISSQSDDILQSLSSHWKYILEVITMNKEIPDHMAKILLWKSENRIIRGYGKKFWIFENDYWKKIDKDVATIYINKLKNEIITDCIYMISDLEEKYTNNLRLLKDTEIIKDKLKTNWTKFIKKNTLVTFIASITNNEFDGYDVFDDYYENPIGQLFLDETFEITNDGKYYGITSKKLYDLREEWIKKNPSENIKSYNENEIGIFGKLLKKHKTWPTETGKITKHLGIKLKLK